MDTLEYTDIVYPPKIGTGICAVLTIRSTQLTPTLCVGDSPGIGLHGKQRWLARMVDAQIRF